MARPPPAGRNRRGPNESCLRPPRGAGPDLAGCARSPLCGRSRSPSQDFAYLADRRRRSPAPDLDPPALQTPPQRGPRTPGLRRWARSGQQGISSSLHIPFPTPHFPETPNQPLRTRHPLGISPFSGISTLTPGAYLPPSPLPPSLLLHHAVPLLPGAHPCSNQPCLPRIPLQDAARTFQKLPRGLPIPCEYA